MARATPAAARDTGAPHARAAAERRLAKRSSSTTGDRRGSGERARASNSTRENSIDPPLSPDAQMMLDSLRASRGESPNAAKIERVSAEVKAESKRKKVASATATAVWKDPFAEDPERPIPVRGSGRSSGRTSTSASTSAAKDPEIMNGSKSKELLVVRRELARARAETAVAQADAAKAQADAAKVKANAARVEASAAQVQANAARHEAEAARAACVVGPDRNKKSTPTLASSSSSQINSSDLVATSTPMRSASAVRISRPSRSSSRSRDGFEEFAQGSRGRSGRRGRAAASNDPFMPAADQDGVAESEMAPPEEEPAPAEVAEPVGRSRGGIVVVPIGQ